MAIQHFLPGGPFAILLAARQSGVHHLERASDDEAARVLGLDEQRDFWDEPDRRIGGRFGPMTLVGARQSWPLDVKIARALTAKRFVLIGDAAHGVHPTAGQGASNLAFRDVAALVEVLTDAARIGLDIGADLRSSATRAGAGSI